ncbi:aromatic ring-opening dioxygenase catalytic subunit LigB [Haematococcus lacustris]
MRQPVVYVSHGAGPLPLLTTAPPSQMAVARSLREVAHSLPCKPSAIVLVTAHWEQPETTVSTCPAPPLLFDYGGFPPESYQLTYPAPGHPQLAKRITQLLRAAGLPNSQDSCRGYDHGTFVPLKVMFPEADVPVVQVSLVDSLDPERHIQVGQALAPLGDENVLLVASGSSFHNLQVFMRSMRNPGSEVKEKDQMQAFNSFLTTTCTTLTGQERNNALAHWAQAPGALLAHPREEHLIPLLVAAGAAGGNPGREVQVGGDVSISHFLFG